MARPTDRRAPRLLVLGAGRHQTPLIRRAEERGIEVVVADYLPDSPGKAFATHPTMVDMLDVDAVAAVAREYAVEGVVTTGTDQSVITMAEVAHRLGLPEIVSPHTARLATDKRCMKDALDGAGVAMARHVVVGPDGAGRESLGALRMPVVVKPSDSQGQRGTRRVDDAAELPDALDAAARASRGGAVVVEEFVAGMEITASAWVEHGRVRTLMVTDRVTYNPPPALGIAVQHVHPSLHAAPVRDDVSDMLERIRAAYGVDRGPMYVQMIVSPERGLHLVEAACRVGGGHEIALIPLVTGVDLRDRLIDLALTGECAPVAYDAPGPGAPVHALVTFLFARPGVVAEQTGFDALVADATIVEGGFYHRVGHDQPTIVDGQGRVGYLIARDEGRAELLARARTAFERLSMRDTAGNEMLFWPEPEWTLG